MSTNNGIIKRVIKGIVKIGDSVKLVSGGPVMIVIGFSRNGRIWCEWKTSNECIDEGSFDPRMLIVSNGESK